MIQGILLLYIGIRFDFPTLYLIGCWVVIIFHVWTFLLGFMKASKNGESGTDKGV